MLCSFLLYNIINEFQVYIYPLPCEPSSHPKDLSKNDFKSKNSGASWISTHTHTHTHTKKINLDVDLTFKQHKKFKILCRSSCLQASRLSRQGLSFWHNFNFFIFYFLRIDILRQLSAFSEVKGIQGVLQSSSG